MSALQTSAPILKIRTLPREQPRDKDDLKSRLKAAHGSLSKAAAHYGLKADMLEHSFRAESITAGVAAALNRTFDLRNLTLECECGKRYFAEGGCRAYCPECRQDQKVIQVIRAKDRNEPQSENRYSRRS